VPTTNLANQKCLPYKWGVGRRRHPHYDWNSASRGFSESPQHVTRYATARQIVDALVNRSRADASSERLAAERLRPEFDALVERWRRETQHLSLISKKVAHPAYFRIIGMGKPVVPLVLEELRDRPSHWFVALRFTANTDPVPQGANPSRAREAWLEWGRAEGLVE
jgi:hypothetical protein